jgi:hypothetical protein
MRFLLALLFLFSCVQAQAQLLSKTFYGTGECNGQDQLAHLTADHGRTYLQLMPPWELFPIRIVGVEITSFDAPTLYMHSGNGYTPDVMLTTRQTEARMMYPGGLGFNFPAIGTPAHVDLHYACPTGRFQVFYTLYYVKSAVP